MNDISLLHISDLHFGAEDADKVNAVYTVVEQYKPHILCITGDVVNFPWATYYSRAKIFIDKLAKHCSNIAVVPGNHDAYLRSWSLRKYEKYIGPRQYAMRTTISGRDVCIFGIDTTCLTIGSLNNAGKFSARSAVLLRHHISELRQALGDNAFERSFKLLLLHHHPLPTISSKTEHMLYLKNAGKLLDLVSRENINLILHGHQHDPAYYALRYNLSGETKSVVVLSAGSATKKTKASAEGISSDTQLHIMELHSTLSLRQWV